MGRCEDCEFWVKLFTDAGECHRYPPIVVRDGAFPQFPRYPSTVSADGCGEFSRREE